MSQTIDISPYAAAVDGGRVSTTLSGYFGGYQGQLDSAIMTATFEDATGKTIGTIVSVGGVTAGDRAQVTGLL